MSPGHIETDVPLRERALRLEARKLPVEALVPLHIHRVGGTHQLAALSMDNHGTFDP